MRSYTVETRSQAVAIFGGPKSLVASMVHKFLSRNIHAAAIASPAELNKLLATHDPDYLVMFDDFVPDEFISTLEPLSVRGSRSL